MNFSLLSCLEVCIDCGRGRTTIATVIHSQREIEVLFSTLKNSPFSLAQNEQRLLIQIDWSTVE